MGFNVKTGILLINLGTPKDPSVWSVGRYLHEFLSDPRVIDLPFLLRKILLCGIILPFRVRKSSLAYQKVWTKAGSPLLLHSEALVKEVAALAGDAVAVQLGMRYGFPSIPKAVNTLLSHGCKRLLVLPLYPQYATASTGSAIAEVLAYLTKQWDPPEVVILGKFYHSPAFIEAFTSLWKQPLETFKADHLLFSYHGVPERQLRKSGCTQVSSYCRANICPSLKQPNCYKAQCYATTQMLSNALNLLAGQYSVSFQSRLGKTPWIEPYTDQLLPQLSKQGIKRLAVACPSFVADCLETLEEIGLRARSQWQELGGEELLLLPSLNAQPVWAQAVLQQLSPYLKME